MYLNIQYSSSASAALEALPCLTVLGVMLCKSSTLVGVYAPNIKMVRYFVSYGLCGLSLSADNLFGGVGGYCTINKNEVILCY